MSKIGLPALRCAMRKLDFPCTAIVIALAIVATASAFASPALADALRADARMLTAPWRAVTGPLVHATWGHLVRDLVLVAIAGIGYEAPLRSVRVPLFVGGIMLPPIVVLLAGDARWYCGLSGLSHALLAAALTYEVMRRSGMVRTCVLVLCAIAVAKPIYELVTGVPAFPMSLGAGVRQVPLAHAVGVMVGIACVVSRQSVVIALGLLATGCGPVLDVSINTELRRRNERAAQQQEKREWDQRQAECQRASGRTCEDPAATELRRERQAQMARKAAAATAVSPVPSAPGLDVPAAAADVPDHLERAMISDGLTGVQATLHACGAGSRATGAVEVSVTVAATGQVAAVSVRTTPDPALGVCVSSAIQGATFAKTLRGGVFVLPVSF